MKRTQLSLLAALTVLPGSLWAQLSYDHAELRYITATVKDTDVTLDGFGLYGSYSLTPDFQAIGSYSSTAQDEMAGRGLENTAYTLGVGARRAWLENVDLVGSLELLSAKASGTGSLNGFEASNTGYALSAGARMRYRPDIELSANVQHAKIFEEGNTAVGFGAEWNLAPAWSLVAGAGFNGDAASYTAGARWHFTRTTSARGASASEQPISARQEPAAVVPATSAPAAEPAPAPKAAAAPAPQNESIAERPAVISSVPKAPAAAPLAEAGIVSGLQVPAGTTLRGRPTQSAPVLHTLDAPTGVEVLASVSNPDGEWKLVRTARRSGWVHSSEVRTR